MHNFFIFFSLEDCYSIVLSVSNRTRIRIHLFKKVNFDETVKITNKMVEEFNEYSREILEKAHAKDKEDQKVKDTLCGTKVMWRKDYFRIKKFILLFVH